VVAPRTDRFVECLCTSGHAANSLAVRCRELRAVAEGTVTRVGGTDGIDGLN